MSVENSRPVAPGAALEGIDVSNYQNMVSWPGVAGANKRFAAIKATEGATSQDAQFPRNWRRAAEAGIVRIAYHFFHPMTNGIVQADYLHDYVRTNGRFSVGDGVMLDLETLDSETPATALAQAQLFVFRILEQTNAGVFIYTNPDFWINTLGNPTDALLSRCPLWLADYGATPPPLGNWPGGLSIWQYTDSGSVPGIRGDVDLDRFYGTLNELQLLCQKGGRP